MKKKPEYPDDWRSVGSSRSSSALSQIIKKNGTYGLDCRVKHDISSYYCYWDSFVNE